jgi:pilus assembly protein CpaE
MKIAFISPNASHLEEIRKILEGDSHSIVTAEGGKSRMRNIAEQVQPDIIITDGMCCDIAELEQVEQVTIEFPDIAVILLCSTHTPEFLIGSMRAGVREVLPSPPAASLLRAAVNRIAAKRRIPGAKPAGKILSFMPCKGGSGATFLATNFGYQLAESQSVLLIDLNLQFGDALSFVHDRPPTVTIANLARDISRLDASFLTTSTVKAAANYSILAAPEDPSAAVEIKPEHIDNILKLAVTQYDYVLLDVPANIDPISIKALDRSERIFPVLQASIPHIRNARKLLNVFDALGYLAEKTELIVNRFEKKGDIGLDDIRRTLGTHVMHTMPNSYKEVSSSINQGSPLMQTARANSVARQLSEFALSLSPKQEEQRGVFSRLFRRA